MNQVIQDPGTEMRALGDDEIARIQAEVVVDRVVLSILRSLRDDSTAESLRDFLLGHVLSGRDTATALLLLGREAPSSEILERIEAKVDALAASGRPPAPRRVREAKPLVLPPAEATAAPRLARMVASNLRPAETAGDGDDSAGGEPGNAGVDADAGRPAPEQAPEPALPGARGDDRPAGDATARWEYGYSSQVRASVADITARKGRPMTEREILDQVTPEMRERIRSRTGRYLWDILKRSCIRIGKDRFWPADRPLPPELGLEWDAVAAGCAVATLPEGNHMRAEQAQDLVLAYNEAAPADRRLSFGIEYSATRDARKRNAKGLR